MDQEESLRDLRDRIMDKVMIEKMYQRHDWATTTRTMVWVKKGKIDGSDCGNGV